MRQLQLTGHGALSCLLLLLSSSQVTGLAGSLVEAPQGRRASEPAKHCTPSSHLQVRLMIDDTPRLNRILGQHQQGSCRGGEDVACAGLMPAAPPPAGCCQLPKSHPPHHPAPPNNPRDAPGNSARHAAFLAASTCSRGGGTGGGCAAIAEGSYCSSAAAGPKEAREHMPCKLFRTVVVEFAPA